MEGILYEAFKKYCDERILVFVEELVQREHIFRKNYIAKML